MHPADIQDRDGGVLVLSTLFGMFPFLQKLFADGGYQGPQFANAVVKVLPSLDIEIVKRPDAKVGFKIIPKRWIVERTIAWLNRCRRLAKDWECRNCKALAFLRLASIRLMLRKLCNPAWCCRDLCWNSMWRNLQRDEVIGSGGEVNWLVDGRRGERLPAIDLAHVDLAGSE